MTREQFLLMKLAEECVEAAQRAIKQVQFGKSEVQKGQTLSNHERLRNELADLAVIVALLQDRDELKSLSYDEFIAAKNAKRENLINI